MANIEGEAAKRAAGASTNLGLSSLTSALKKARGKGSGEKSGADYHNETLAQLYGHGISESAKDSEFGRQGERRGWMKEDIEAHGRTKSMAYGADGSAKWEAYPSTTGRTAVTASGGKKTTPSGASGNTKGKQFKRTVGKAVGTAAKKATVAGAGAVAGAAAGAVTKNPKVAEAAATLGSAGAEAIINKASTARKTRATGKPQA